ILLLVLTSFSCSPKLAPDAGWGRGRWVLVEMKGVPVQQSGGRKDAFINFEVDQKKFRGNGGCNQVNGNYSVEKNTIKFSEVISTKMSCNDIDFENAFLSNLGNVNRHEMKGEDLLLKRKREVLLVLRAK
ncbi:MAG: META domain-containing protein, partial [Chitinophagaceae bacterium]